MNPDPVPSPSGTPLRTRSSGERFLDAGSPASRGGPERSPSSVPPEIRSPGERILREARERDEDQVAELGELLARWEVVCSHRLRAMAARCALSVPEFLALSELTYRRLALSGAQLAGIIGIGTGGMTGVLARLEEQELIERTPDPFDGRKIEVYATDFGRDLLRESDGDVAGPGTADLLKGMTSEEVDAVVLFVGRAVDRAYRQAWYLRDLRPKR